MEDGINSKLEHIVRKIHILSGPMVQISRQRLAYMLYGATWFAVRSDVVIATKNIWKEVNLFYKPRIADKTKYEKVFCVIESEDVKY